MRKALISLLLATGCAPLALAGHSPVRDEMQTIRVLAHRVEISATNLSRAGGRGRPWLDRREQIALRQLRELQGAAERFHRRVLRRDRSSRGSDADFQRLVFEYRRAAASISDLRPDRQVRRDWLRLEADMERLVGFYTSPPRWGGHGRDRDDRLGQDAGALQGTYQTRSGASIGIAVRW